MIFGDCCGVGVQLGVIDTQCYLAEVTDGISDFVTFRADFWVIALFTSGVRSRGGAFSGVGELK